ncbi:MAG TPA: FxLYD domain-containing protein [Thermoanaerobaculia bacterium]
MRRALTTWLAILPAALLAAGPAAADRLQTRDGALVETKGPWKIQGSLVIFTLPNGTLSSLRVSEVDLDASAVATMEARNPPPPPPEPEPREAVAEITMKQVRRAPPPRPAEEAEGSKAAAEGAGGEGGAPPPPPPPPVNVIAWRPAEGRDGALEILGTLRNEGREIVTDLGVTVSLFDEAGATVATANAFLGAVSLAPGTTTTMRALFPDVYRFAGEPSFQVRANPIRIQGVGTAPPGEASAQEAGGES